MKSYNTIILLIFTIQQVISDGILYHRDSQTRQSINLNGLWNFRLSNSTNDPYRGYNEKWYKNWKNSDELPVPKVPVPSSYNDLGTDSKLRDYVGIVWYHRHFFIPKEWNDRLIWIRFDSVCYSAEVWINGKSSVTHSIGHLPFVAQIQDLVNFGDTNNITVAVNNYLDAYTIPQGYLFELDSGRIKQNYSFDFFNYAGIDRNVYIYTTPKLFIDDVDLYTEIDGDDGVVNFEVQVKGVDPYQIDIKIFNKNQEIVAKSSGTNGTITLTKPKFWWPYLMDPEPGYLYTFSIEISDFYGKLVDTYRLPFGIRTINWTDSSLLINNRPVYLRGFGKHEDSDFRGKGLDLPVIIKDYNLIKWIGANAYRTSHYPYAEEIMDLADELGIMIIDECPAVAIENVSDELLENHKRSLTELIKRDKNRPSVIIWSVANEPKSTNESVAEYFKEIVAHTKNLDKTRPTTLASYVDPLKDYSVEYVDIISFNVYRGWYENPGDLDTIPIDFNARVNLWRTLYKKPLLLTEYGADTLLGYHSLPSFIWSEEYQALLMSQHFKVFDKIRSEGYFIGELIWTFADFDTLQTFIRVGGNKKGIFTRNRQPKFSAYVLRQRYWQLAHELDNVTLPDDLNIYIIKNDELVIEEL